MATKEATVAELTDKFRSSNAVVLTECVQRRPYPSHQRVQLLTRRHRAAIVNQIQCVAG